MFYCAEALLTSRGLRFSSHRGVHSAFAQRLVKTGDLPAEMHAWLREAFDKRQVGDYIARSTFDVSELEAMQRNAAEFVERTRKFLKERNPWIRWVRVALAGCRVFSW